jgi:protein-disulfide isomerase
MPLDFHNLAFKAAEVTRCASEQGKYWEMHDRLMENQKTLEPWTAHAQALGLDVAKFEACLASGKYAESIRAGIAIAQSAGATGTPGFLLAETDPKDPKKVKGIVFIKGAKPFADFKAEIDKALAK